MFRLALRMLFGDRAKYLLLISGITFATVLMAFSASLFLGLMSWTYATVRNVRSPIWVADPKVEQVNDTKPLRDTDINRIRSVKGVAWAVPLYQGVTQARLLDGAFQSVTLIGIDQETLIGAPSKMIAGSLQNLRLPNTVIIDDYAAERLSARLGRPIGVGDVFEINDAEARIVGVCKAYRSMTGGPFVFTTYDRAITDYTPSQRRLLSYVLAAPQSGYSVEDVAGRITRETGLRGFSENEMMWSTINWFVTNTGVPINVGMIVVIGLIVGAVISAQTFYSFVVENTRHLGALKAMGTSNLRLCGMLILQALSVGFIGYGIGIGIVTMNGNFALKLQKVPFLITWHIPVGALGAVLLVCAFAAMLGILRVSRVDPASVFR